MSKASNTNYNPELPDDLEMLDEYDFSQGVRGKHYIPNINPDRQPVVVRIRSEDGDRYVTMRIIEVQAVITPDGKLTAQVPSDILPGKHRVVLRIEQPAFPPTTEATDEINGLKDDIEEPTNPPTVSSNDSNQ